MAKFLIIRFSSIGDIVLTSPVTRCLKEQLGNSTIHFLTKKQFSFILSQNPSIDRVIEFDKGLKKLIEILKKEKYDYIIDLHNNLRTSIIKSSLRIPFVSYQKLNFQKWLYTSLKINRMPDIHIVDRYLETLHTFGVVNDHSGLEYFIPKEDEVSPTMLPEEFNEGFVALVIGAKHATKQLPPEKIEALCKRLLVPIILLGGPEDKPVADWITNDNELSHVFNGCGKFNFNQSASIVKQSNLVITHDTGLMHVAAAFHKDIISIWGNTVPEFGMYPYVPGKVNVQFEVKGLKCRPCTKIGKKACPKGHFKCMNLQNIDEIANVAMTYLNMEL